MNEIVLFRKKSCDQKITLKKNYTIWTAIQFLENRINQLL